MIPRLVKFYIYWIYIQANVPTRHSQLSVLWLKARAYCGRMINRTEQNMVLNKYSMNNWRIPV